MAFFPFVPFFGSRYIRAFWSVLITKSTVSVRFRSMDEEQREEFLEEFEQEREKSLVAFCVMGGSFFQRGLI